MNHKLFTIMAIIAFTLSACNKETKEEELTSPLTKDVKMLNATSYEKWIYFSLTKGEIIEVTNPEQDFSWDIAFQRWYVKTNSGTSGKGKGGAINTKEIDWNKINKAPLSGYKTDEIGILHGWDNIKNIETKKEGSFSKEASIYVTYISGGKYKNKKEIYIIKTAQGKYAKIQFYDYVNEKLKGGYPSFRYKISDNDIF